MALQLHGLLGVGHCAMLRIVAAVALGSTAFLDPASAGQPAPATTPPAAAAAATTPPAAAAAATTPTPTPVLPAASGSATVAAAPPLLTVNKTGLWELGPDLKPVRRLSKSPATYGRYLPGRQHVLIYGHSGADEQSPVLRLFDRTTQQERVITRLPTSAAPSVFYADAQEERVRLLLQQGRDFCTDGKNACLVLMNRNINMMDETARLTVSLATGKQKLEPLACQPGRDPSAACKRARESLGGYFCPCSFVDENPPEGKEDGFPYRIKDGAIQQRAAGAA